MKNKIYVDSSITEITEKGYSKHLVVLHLPS